MYPNLKKQVKLAFTLKLTVISISYVSSINSAADHYCWSSAQLWSCSSAHHQYCSLSSHHGLLNKLCFAHQPHCLVHLVAGPIFSWLYHQWAVNTVSSCLDLVYTIKPVLIKLQIAVIITPSYTDCVKYLFSHARASSLDCGCLLSN